MKIGKINIDKKVVFGIITLVVMIGSLFAYSFYFSLRNKPLEKTNEKEEIKTTTYFVKDLNCKVENILNKFYVAIDLNTYETDNLIKEIIQKGGRIEDYGFNTDKNGFYGYFIISFNKEREKMKKELKDVFNKYGIPFFYNVAFVSYDKNITIDKNKSIVVSQPYGEVFVSNDTKVGDVLDVEAKIIVDQYGNLVSFIGYEKENLTAKPSFVSFNGIINVKEKLKKYHLRKTMKIKDFISLKFPESCKKKTEFFFVEPIKLDENIDKNSLDDENIPYKDENGKVIISGINEEELKKLYKIIGEKIEDKNVSFSYILDCNEFLDINAEEEYVVDKKVLDLDNNKTYILDENVVVGNGLKIGKNKVFITALISRDKISIFSVEVK